MVVKTITVGSIEENTYVVYDEKTLESVVIDPGFEGERIYAFITEKNLKVRYIILTHTHYDHIGAVPYLKKMTGAKVCAHKDDAEGLLNPRISLAGFFSKNQDREPADIILNDGDELAIENNNTFTVIHTPGHTKGGICILYKKLLFSGDTLFRGDVGRCDLPGGDYKEILNSIQNKLMRLSDNITVYPGHGPSSSIGYERAHNQYTKKEAYDLW